MKRSTDRILTTHVGSLVRPKPILEGMKRRTLGEPHDEAQLAQDIKEGIKDVVRRQVEVGIDVPSDGEFWREGCHCYIHERLSGLQALPLDMTEDLWGAGADREQQKFPEFFEQYHDHFRYIWMHPDVDISRVPNVPGNYERFNVVDKITYKGHDIVQRDIATLREALEGLEVADAFITAATPSQRVRFDRGVMEIYKDQDEYLYSVAEAMNEEYKAIADSGFILQIDLGVLNPRRGLLQDDRAPDQATINKAMDRAVDIVNHSIKGIPEEKIRYHHCWGSMNSPHTQDAPLTEIVHHMLKVKAGAYVLEAANPRHEHEWMVWKDVKLPDGKILIPGIVTHQTNVVEHPELVAWRIENYASVVGKENLIAGTDCGFSQYWDSIRVHPTVQWAKLQSLAEGAALASKKLWG